MLVYAYERGFSYDNYKAGAEWVSDYSGNRPWGDLEDTELDAVGFYNTLPSSWWSGFLKGNGDAWESHWEKSTVGGSDYSDIETVDFAYFAGHGNSSSFIFGTNHDGGDTNPYQVHYTEVTWGDRDLEWVVLASCNTLNLGGYQSNPDDVFHRWGMRMKGLHGIMGFDTACNDDPMGQRFVEYMSCLQGPVQKIGDAWKEATIDVQTSNVWGAYLFVRGNENDYLPGYGPINTDKIPVDPSTQDFVYWWWSCE